MKTNELRDKNMAELTQELQELKSELFKLRFQHATNQLDNPIKLKNVKKDMCEDSNAGNGTGYQTVITGRRFVPRG